MGDHRTSAEFSVTLWLLMFAGAPTGAVRTHRTTDGLQRRPAWTAMLERVELTAFQEVNVRPPIGALAVVDLLHVAGVLIGSGVQDDAVSSVWLQRL